MLLERQQKLAKDESELNSVLQKVTEMLNNQRNIDNQEGITIFEASQSKSSIHEVNHSGSKIIEEISSAAKSVTSEIKTSKAADKTADDYDNATFESDDSTTPRSRRSVLPRHAASELGEANVEDETFSLTGGLDICVSCRNNKKKRLRCIKNC